jgi:hypothetical protein
MLDPDYSRRPTVAELLHHALIRDHLAMIWRDKMAEIPRRIPERLPKKEPESPVKRALKLSERPPFLNDPFECEEIKDSFVEAALLGGGPNWAVPNPPVPDAYEVPQ